jgi:membrane-associated phospholipid phosphatase
MFQLGSKQLKVAMGISLGLASCLLFSSLLYSRETVFLWLNHDFGKVVDQVFLFFTLLAEGWMWIPYFLLVFGWFKKDTLIILLNFLLSTLLTQIPKQLFWPNISRPIASNINPIHFHTVPGVEMHAWNSFPSGHTATAFTIYFVTVYLFPKNWVVAVGFVYALACGYSRIYLGQHFPLDIGGGILVGITSILLSLYLRKKIRNEKAI